jgi:hypothetical protein
VEAATRDGSNVDSTLNLGLFELQGSTAGLKS